MLQELLGEVFLNGTTVPTCCRAASGHGSQVVSTPAEYVGNHPTATPYSTRPYADTLVIDEVGLEDLLAVTVAGYVEVGPVFVRRYELILTRVDEVTQILAGSGRIVGKHSSLTSYELCKALGHAGCAILIASAATLGQ